MFEYYYHGTIRKVVVAFASLFNNIYVSRKDENDVEIERFKVPVAYGPQQKFLRRLDRIGESFDTNQVRLETYLPRIAFEITNIQYDSTRKLNSIQQTVAFYANDKNTLYRRYEKVPYNLTFTVSVMSKTMDDALQIMEQILPYFGPEYTFTIKAVNPTDQDVDIPIVFSSSTLSDGDDGSYGDYSSRKITTANMQFTAKMYLYGPVDRQGVIKQTDINLFTKNYGAAGPTAATIHTVIGDPNLTAGGFSVDMTGPSGAITTIIEY